MSAAALDQRRAAPWKTGHHSRSLLTQVAHPCKPGLCPLTDELKGNCSIKVAMAEKQKNLEVCPVGLADNEETRSRILQAMNGGGLEAVNELTANLLAGMYDLAADELVKLRRNGFSIERPIVGKNADGEPEIVGYIPTVNPGAEPTLKLLEMVGATGAQATVTNKSRGERAVGESIDDLAKMLMARAASRVVEVQPALPADTPKELEP